MGTRITFGQYNLGPHLFCLLQPAPCHGDGVLGIGPPYPAPGPAAERIFTIVGHFHKVRGNLPDGVARFFVDPAMPSQIARVMIGHPLVRLHPKIKPLKKLGNVYNVDTLLLEFRILGFVVEGAKTIRASGDDRPGAGSHDNIHILLCQILVYPVPDIFKYAAATNFIDQGVINPQAV